MLRKQGLRRLKLKILQIKPTKPTNLQKKLRVTNKTAFTKHRIGEKHFQWNILVDNSINQLRIYKSTWFDL